ncbi:MAG: hypothetical protein ACI376_04425 [Candidatus Bruticola sp.]
MTSWKNFTAVMLLTVAVFANTSNVWAGDKEADKNPKPKNKICQCDNKSKQDYRCSDKDRQKDCQCQDKKNSPNCPNGKNLNPKQDGKFAPKQDGKRPGDIENKKR